MLEASKYAGGERPPFWSKGDNGVTLVSAAALKYYRLTFRDIQEPKLPGSRGLEEPG